jgi:hypothetical protein
VKWVVDSMKKMNMTILRKNNHVSFVSLLHFVTCVKSFCLQTSRIKMLQQLTQFQ